MEGASEETLTSVSSLVTVFEKSRYGLVEVGRVIRAVWHPLGPWETQVLPVSWLRSRLGAALNPDSEQCPCPGPHLLSGQCPHHRLLRVWKSVWGTRFGQG